MPRSHSAHRKLALETLEDRSLMAGNVTASMVGSKLVIQGDGEANHVVLSFDRATQRYHVSGQETAGGVRRRSTAPIPLRRRALRACGRLPVVLGDGDDTLEILNPAATDVVIAQYFLIDAGGGDDTVVFGRVGNRPAAPARSPARSAPARASPFRPVRGTTGSRSPIWKSAGR